MLNTEEMGPEVLKLVKERFEERLKTRSKEVNIREWTSIIGQLSVILVGQLRSFSLECAWTCRRCLSTNFWIEFRRKWPCAFVVLVNPKVGGFHKSD